MALAGEIGRLPPTPVPDSATVSGIVGLLVVMLQFALSVEPVEGVKTKDAVQFAKVARLAPHVVEVTAKSCELLPETVPVLSVTELLRLFVTVMVCVELGEP